ncbi:MAG: CoxG family protein [Gemmobacter sp.]|jgi:carbon monoxide dehydrogenase subunit G
MNLSDSRHIAAPPETVWAALFDPEVLKACVPGCESMTGSAETGFEAVVVQKVGPVSARFAGAVALRDIDPGRGCTIAGEGKGGAAGFAKGAARVTLEPDADGTLLRYEVDASVGGKLAQLGSRIIDGFARKLADEFFERFQAAVEGPAEDAPADADADAEGEDKPRKGWFRRLVSREG